MSLPKFQSNWDGFKGQVSVKWDKLSEDELLKVEGNLSELVSLISTKYDEQKAGVEAKVSTLYKGYLQKKEQIAKSLSEVREGIEEQSNDLSESIKQRAGAFQKNATETMKKIREENIDPAVQQSEEYIKIHPFSAVMGAFGVGMLLGGIFGLLMKGDSK